MKFISFIKEWALIFAIIGGILAYFIYISLPLPEQCHVFANGAVAVVQPALIFAMLFLTFCKINPRELRICRWHVWIVMLQTGLFTLIGLLLLSLPTSPSLRVVLEGAMLCLICPTATAAAVITRKLGGNVSGVTTYTILINIANAIFIPLLVPYVHPHAGMGALTSSVLILGKVFPLLLLPLVSAMVLRAISVRVVDRIARYQNLSFYLWSVALALAMTVTTRSIVHSTVALPTMLWLVAVSLACCIFQFKVGHRIGVRYGDPITAGQAFGQKNTVLAIWMGYTFFTPVTSIVGGFYSIWHNVYNSWQLHQQHRRE